MRRDVFIENDSGGFSIVASDTLDAIIADGRGDDEQFVTGFKALLLELVGDDSMPVRIVVDEPLDADEDAQWLARASWRIDSSDGRLLVMGGFDPDVMQWWKDDTGGARDGRGVALVEAAPGSWRVDVYAHAGSMNGRAILGDGDERTGAAFRRAHPDRAFPLWLAKMLEFSGEDDPGHEELWRNVPASRTAGRLEVDTENAAVIGLLVHLTPASAAPGDPPAGGWFGADMNRRTPTIFPLGLPASIDDPELASFRDRLLGWEAPQPELPIVSGVVEVIERWTGDPFKRLAGEEPRIALDPADIYLLYWIAALTADSPPRFELWVEPTGGWSPPAATAEFGVAAKAGRVTALGPAPNAGGWSLWWAARHATHALAGVPDKSTIDFAMTPRLDYDADLNPTIGRALYSGTVVDGAWQITEASPVVSRETLAAALAFVRELVANRIHVANADERTLFDAEAEFYSSEEGSLFWDGDRVSMTDPDERTLIMLAQKVFRARFADSWPMSIDS